jgi:hypothetical protein
MGTCDDTSRRNATAVSDDAALSAIAEFVEVEVGDRFFSSLARKFAPEPDVQYTFVTRLFDEGTHFTTLTSRERALFGGNVELPLRGTPCETY